jgi:DNA polymerase-3 subunit epsilon
MSSLHLFSNIRLNLKKPLVFFDIESTGVDIIKDRIIDLCLLKVLPDGKETIYNFRFNPGIPIPREASMVHGIFDEDVITAPAFKDKAAEIYDLLNDADLAGFNSNKFDLPLLLEEFIRAGFSFSIDNRCLIDIHKIYLMYEKRNLESAYQFYCGKTLKNAHSAEADARATYEVLIGQLQRYTDLPNDVVQLHQLSNEEKFIDSGRRFVVESGKPVFNFGKYKGKTVEEVLKQDPGYYSWMMNGEFSLHTKQKLKEIREQLKKDNLI